MELLFEIISPQRHSMPEEKSHFTFKAVGGTIGRSANNDWPIDDSERLMSGQHATIYFEDNHFLIMDKSTNGLFINQSEQPLLEEFHVIANGDRFSMGQFVFQATLIATQSTAVFSSSAVHRASVPLLPDEIPAELAKDLAHNHSHNLFNFADPLEVGVAESAPGSLSSHDILSESDPVNSVLDPIPSTQSYFDLPNAIPDDWQNHDSNAVTDKEQAVQSVSQVGNFEDFQKDFNLKSIAPEKSIAEKSVPEKTVQEQLSKEALDQESKFQQYQHETIATESVDEESDSSHTPASLSDHNSGYNSGHNSGYNNDKSAHYQAAIESLLKTLGIEADDISSEELPGLAKNIALVAKDSMSGIMQTMMARAHMKNEFRLSMTTIQTQENNPLKFCINNEQLVHYMLLNPMTGYLDAEQAVKESFHELQEHQVGVMAGMKAALLYMLDKLSPENIASKSARNKTAAIGLGNKKARYWDAYNNLYQDILAEDDVFKSLFANEFCRAYEHQIENIRQTRS